MTLHAALVVALAAVTGALLVLVAVVAVNNVAQRRRRERRERRIAAVRPAVIALAAADERDEIAGVAGQLRRAERRTLEDVAYEFLPKVRGAGRAALVDLLVERGVVRSARRRLTKIGAVGRARAAATLGMVRDLESIDDLAARLGDRDPEVRFVAARSLGQIRDSRCVAPLLDSLTARRALPLSTVSMWVLAIGPVAVDPLRDALGGDEPLARAVATELLGRLGALAAADDLIAALGDPHPRTRSRAARSLGLIGAPRAVAPLLAVSADGDNPAELRRAAVGALAAIEDPSTIGALAEMLGDADHGVAHAAAQALSRLGPGGRDQLEFAVAGAAPDNGSNGEVPAGGAAAHAAEALARMALAEARHRERHH